jgi:type I restriction enzyme S subunit
MLCKETNFQETTLGKVPKDWQVAKLMDVTTCKKGRAPKSFVERTEQDSLPYLSAESLRTGEFTKWVRKTDDIVRVCRDDALLIWDGYYCGDSFTGYEGALSSTMVKVETENLLNKKFLFYFLRTHFRELNSKISGMYLKHVNKKVFESLLILFPSILEQQQIVEVLSCVDLAIQKTDEVIAKTERLKKGLMQELLTRGIGHKEYKDSKELEHEIPKEWEVARLDHLIEKGVITYHLDGNHGELYPREEEFVSQGVPFLSANMITDGSIDLGRAKYVTEERAKQFRKGVAEDGDVLFAHNATVGPAAILRTDLPYVVLGTTLTSYRCNPDYLNNQYLKYYMEGPHFQKQLHRIMKQTTRNQVPITAQRKLYFVIPNVDEQRGIAETISTADRKLDLERKEKRRLERIKRGLMDLLLTGKIRIKVN